MEKFTQHEAVIVATKNVLGDAFQEGVDVKTYITKEQRAAVIDQVVAMFNEGAADLSEKATAKFDSASKLRNYTCGLVTNWFNRSRELNGGVKHEAKNPGSRQGSSDPQLKQLRQLREVTVASGNTVAIAKVDAAIEARTAEIESEREANRAKAKISKIDINLLPEDLRDLLAEVA